MATVNEHIATLRAARRARDATIAALPVGSTAFSDYDGRTFYVISLDPYNPEQWRASRFDNYGATGHTVNATFPGAVVDALEFGAILASATPVTPSTVDDVARGFGLSIGCDAPVDVEVALYLDGIAAPHG